MQGARLPASALTNRAKLRSQRLHSSAIHAASTRCAMERRRGTANISLNTSTVVAVVGSRSWWVASERSTRAMNRSSAPYCRRPRQDVDSTTRSTLNQGAPFYYNDDTATYINAKELNFSLQQNQIIFILLYIFLIVLHHVYSNNMPSRTGAALSSSLLPLSPN